MTYKFFWIFVDGHPFFGETKAALLFFYPWLFLVIPGVIFWIRQEGRVAAVALSAVALNWIFYLGYNDFLPSDLYRYFLIHYLVWAFLPLILIAAAACLRGWRDPWTLAGFGLAALAVIFSSGIGLEERALPLPGDQNLAWELPAARPLLLKFSGNVSEIESSLHLDGRPLLVCSDYLAPEAPTADQRLLLLGTKSPGRLLTLSVPVKPSRLLWAGEYVWTWRLDSARVVAACK